jgi:hypothetical protein
MLSTGGARSGSPLFLLDGMDVGYEGIAAIPLSMIERVDVVSQETAYVIFGEKGYNGAISFTTKDDWGSTSGKVYHSVNVSFKGYTEPRVFYSPKHHAKLESDYKPDLRTTLFWEPNIKLENNKEVLLNYFNADNPSKVKVIVEGITTNGIPVTATTEYEVK